MAVMSGTEKSAAYGLRERGSRETRLTVGGTCDPKVQAEMRREMRRSRRR